MIIYCIELYKSLIKGFGLVVLLLLLLLLLFSNCELLRCDFLLSAVRELETIFLGGEAMGRA